MSKTRSKGLAILLTIVMLVGLMPVSGLASSSVLNPVTVTWYTDNTFTVTNPARPATGYSSLYDAFDAISSGDFATVYVGPGYRGDNSSFTMNQAAEVHLSSGSSTNVFLGTITMNNSSAILQLTSMNIDASGNAIDVRAGDLMIGSGSLISGSSRGVYNRGGTVRFSGGQVSSYEASSSATTIGTPSYIPSTPSPSPGNVSVTGVTLSPSALNMRVGGSQQLTTTVSPSNATNKNVRYWSSDTSVVTVTSGGLVRAVGSGWAYIRVTTVDGSYTAYTDVEVGVSNVAVTSVSISGTRSINVGGSSTLTANVRPSNASNKNVTWSSSNSNVATVNSSGVVRGISQGTASIRVRTQDGGYTSSVTVTVSAPQPPASVVSDIARSTKLYLNGSSSGGTVARSSSYVQLRPKGSNAVQENKLSIQVRAFDRLSEDGYSSLRYRLPWLYVDMGTRMSRGMDSSDRLEISVKRLNYSYNTMSSRMNDKWKTYSNKNISGPWEVNSNSDEEAMTVRILLPKNISKSKMRVLSWNGSSFVSLSTSKYSVVRIGTQYFLRLNNVGNGVYAVVER